jgi:NAD(P) transhydrogenase
VPHIYAAGDVIGPPALASTSMEQGRRAIRHALGVPVEQDFNTIPVGIFAIPEMSCVGMTEQQVIESQGGALVGTADFAELARGQIAGATDGFLKLVSDAQGQRVMGVQILGAGATELVHIGQMALLAGHTVDVLVEVTFNFPTLAEAYRVAALNIVGKREALTASPA